MNHVFISYVWENSEIVDRLVRELRSNNIVVWLDRDNIFPGQRWRDVIRKAISNGAYFIACFSKEYNSRERTHMNEELTLAIDELRARRSESSWFIPVLINQTEIPDIRISSTETLRDIHCLPLYDDWQTSIDKLSKIIRSRDESHSNNKSNKYKNSTLDKRRTRPVA